MKIKTIIELEELLNTPEYKFEIPESKHVKAFERANRWTHPDTLDLWDEIVEETGLPPAPSQYLDKAFEKTKEFWHWDSDKGRLSDKVYSNGGMSITYIAWSEDIEIAIKNRLARMYISFMAEYSAQILIGELFPDSLVLASNELDLVVGVDLAVLNRENDSSFFVHVTKDNRWTDRSIQEKSEKKMWLRDSGGKKHWYQREWNSSHVVFGYTDEESESTKNVNGHLIFRKDYVQEVGEEVMQESKQTYKDNEMVDFNRWLTRNYIRVNGVKDMIVFQFGKYK